MALQTNSGGKITNLKAVGHETFKGVADWFFVGDVEYFDGSKGENRQIPPFALCYESDADKPALDAAMQRLNDYLRRNGEWHDAKETRDGRMYSWTPAKPKGQEPL